MPSDSKLNRLFRDIVTATESGNLSWTETANADEFVTSFGKGKYLLKALGYTEIDEEGDKTGSPSFVLIRSEDETELLTLTHQNTIAYPYEFQNAYRSIHDRALGIEDAVEDVLKELELNSEKIKDDDIPF